MQLVSILEKIRLERGLNDTEFARLLGVHKDMWSKTKLGKADVGWSICTGALRELRPDYPELEHAIVDFMASVRPSGRRGRQRPS